MPSIMLLAKSAYRAIESDCLVHGPNESGGVLPGRKMGEEFIVPFSIGAGPRAARTPVHFSPDSSRQQVVLDFLFERFAVDYLGDWHRHPGAYDQPSEHDVRTARRIVTDPAWGKEEALFPIATIAGSRVQLRAYLMCRSTLEFEEIELEVIADKDPRMLAVLFGTETPGKENSHEQQDGLDRPPGNRRISRVLRRAAASLRRLSRV